MIEATGLFASAFLSATLLPGSSEAVLAGLLALGRGDALVLVAVASLGNVLGSCVNWAMGRYLSAYRDRRWFPGGALHGRAEAWFARHGKWSLLMSWLPVVGDPLTVLAGVLRVGFLPFVLLVAAGKTARYAFVAGAVLWWNGA